MIMKNIYRLLITSLFIFSLTGCSASKPLMTEVPIQSEEDNTAESTEAEKEGATEEVTEAASTSEAVKEEQEKEPSESTWEGEVNTRQLLVGDGVNLSSSVAKLIDSASGGKKENFMASPASLVACTQMAELAAGNNTYEQLHKFNGGVSYDLDSEAVNTYNFFVNNTLGGAVVKDSFVEALQSMKAEAIDLTKENRATLANELNKKVADVTNNQITQAIDAETFDSPFFQALLANVIHFKGTWMDTETYDIVKEYEFTKENGEIVLVDALDMMNTDSMQYYESDHMQAFSVSYKENGGRYSFYGFLPKENDFRMSDLSFEELTTPSYPDGYRIYVKIPKFEFSSSMGLNDTLKSLGLTDMFDLMVADFTNGYDTTNGGNVYVTSVTQKTKIDFNEKGTEASAYTGMEIATTSIDIREPEIIRLDFNRPFAFMIWDHEESIPLFVGQVYDPSVIN